MNKDIEALERAAAKLHGLGAREGTSEKGTVAVPERVAILQEGAKLTGGDRDKTYGDPSINLACSGELKAVFRKFMRRDMSVQELEAIDMVLTKVGRIATGPKPHRDNYVDASTYMAIAGEQALQQEQSKLAAAAELPKFEPLKAYPLPIA